MWCSCAASSRGRANLKPFRSTVAVPPVDLLFITCNRREYVEKSLGTLLGDDTDFRVYWWDNGSTDGAADIVSSCRDPRIVARHISPENVLQFPAILWFLDHARGDVIGKVDDDTLVPTGWTEPIADLVRRQNNIGMIGCWTFWPDDFDRHRAAAARRIVRLGDHQILHNGWIGGTAFLMRKDLARRRIIHNHDGTGFPINRLELTIEGYVSGWYYPLLWAEHMDDPRSGHCLMNRPGGMGVTAALTARARRLSSPEEYLAWIIRDADYMLTTPVARQVRHHRWQKSLPGRLVTKLRAAVR